MPRLIALASLLTAAACASAGSSDCAALAGFAEGAPAMCAGGERERDRASAGLVMTPAEYCTSENGFSAGARGEAYGGVCEGSNAEAFRAGYAKGEKLLALEHGAIAAEQALSETTKDLWRVKRRIMESDARRMASTTPRAERAELAAMLKALHEERESLQVDIDRLAARKSEADLLLAKWREALAADRIAAGESVTPPAKASYP